MLDKVGKNRPIAQTKTSKKSVFMRVRNRPKIDHLPEKIWEKTGKYEKMRKFWHINI